MCYHHSKILSNMIFHQVFLGHPLLYCLWRNCLSAHCSIQEEILLDQHLHIIDEVRKEFVLGCDKTGNSYYSSLCILTKRTMVLIQNGITFCYFVFCHGQEFNDILNFRSFRQKCKMVFVFKVKPKFLITNMNLILPLFTSNKLSLKSLEFI